MRNETTKRLGINNAVMVRYIFLSIAIGFGSLAFGQFVKGNSWSYSFYLGASNILGDLGGNAENSYSDFRDIDYQALRPAIGVGIQHHKRNVTYSSEILFTQLVGNDAHTNNNSRNARNLSVRTDLIEANIKSEVMPFKKGSRFAGLYFNAGLGGIYFQPKAKYDGTWYKLRPLGTEGQNYISGLNPYKKFSLVIPFGTGYKININRFTTMKVDLSLRKSFTDYLDDVSTNYANSSQIAEAGGSVAGLLSNRSRVTAVEGSQRGNPQSKDNYYFIGLKLERTIGAKKYDDCTNFEIPSRKSKKR